MKATFKEKALSIIRKKGLTTAMDLCGKFNISRNYANIILKELREEGEVVLVGKTNHARYVLATDKTSAQKALREIKHISFKLQTKGLDESSIFNRIERETGIILDLESNVVKIFRYAFTEILNNAIDHSSSKIVKIDSRRSNSALTFVIRDFGIGIFNNVKEKFRLPNTLAAIQEILKGKTTTDPKHHSGEGVFFTSKIADTFIIDSYEKRLTVNNLLPDIFIADRKMIKGTRVSFTIHLNSKRKIEEIYRMFTSEGDDGFDFDKTRITVKLFQFGQDLPSRSEAKRVTMNLENFQEIEFDFTDVATIGQGFADEIFRVWQNRFQNIKLSAINTNENVAFMIKRVGGEVKS